MTTTTDQTVAYHWVMTVQTADGRQATTDGTSRVIEGVHTRRQLYNSVYEQVKKHFGLNSVGTTVLFFSIEPNMLGGGR